MDSFFGRNTAKLRTALQITQDTLARHAGISRSMLSKIERGEVNPTIITAGKLARSLNTTISALSGEHSFQTDHPGNIQHCIHSLRAIDEQLAKLIIHRQEFAEGFPVDLHQIYILDKECRCLFASSPGERHTRRSPAGDSVGQWREPGLPREFTRRFEQQVMNMFSAGKPLAGEMLLPSESGVCHFDYRLKPLVNKNGCVEAVIASLQNATGNRMAQLELANQFSRHDQIIHLSPIGISTVDRYGVITAINQHLQILLSLHSSASWVGQEIGELLERTGLSQLQAPIAGALRGEAPCCRQNTGTGYLVSAFPLRNIAGAIDGGIVFLQQANTHQK